VCVCVYIYIYICTYKKTLLFVQILKSVTLSYFRKKKILLYTERYMEKCSIYAKNYNITILMLLPSM